MPIEGCGHANLMERTDESVRVIFEHLGAA